MLQTPGLTSVQMVLRRHMHVANRKRIHSGRDRPWRSHWTCDYFTTPGDNILIFSRCIQYTYVKTMKIPWMFLDFLRLNLLSQLHGLLTGRRELPRQQWEMQRAPRKPCHVDQMINWSTMMGSWALKTCNLTGHFSTRYRGGTQPWPVSTVLLLWVARGCLESYGPRSPNASVAAVCPEERFLWKIGW